MTVLSFEKMEGLGNDFVVLVGQHDLTDDDVQAMCDRRRGIGADGVLVMTPAGQDRVNMDYQNADGSPAEMCGNGIRCVVRHATTIGWLGEEGGVINTAVGERRGVVLDPNLVRVELGPVSTGAEVTVGERPYIPVDAGNPHLVTHVESLDDLDIDEISKSVQEHAGYSDGVNVEFVEVSRPGVRMRVWERGVGETLACGTGAASVAAVVRGEGTTVVSLPGGQLEVEIVDDIAWLTGPARHSFSGEWSR